MDKLLHALPTVQSSPHLGSKLEKQTKDGLLAWNEKHKMENLTIIIDSIFDIKTDRNNITPTEMQRLLTDRDFTVGLAIALQDFRLGTSTHHKNFNDMVNFMDGAKTNDTENDIKNEAEKRARETLEAGSIWKSMPIGRGTRASTQSRSAAAIPRCRKIPIIWACRRPFPGLAFTLSLAGSPATREKGVT